MPEGRITYAKQDGFHVLRYAGRVDYTLAPAVGRYVDGLFADASPPDPFLFDLRETSLVDSTNLGLLARVAERVRVGRGDTSGACVILSDSDEITDILTSMGFEAIFDIAANHPAGDKKEREKVITPEQPSDGELLRTMLEAHRTLAGLNERDHDQFKDVVRMLEAEMRAR